MKKIVIAGLVLVSCYIGYAQETTTPELITDRPDATESPNVVPLKHLQVESGGFYTTFTDDNDFQTEFIGATTLLRYGLLERLELRLGWDFIENQNSFDGNDFDNVFSGFTPLLAGVKVAVAEEKGLLPEIGLIGHIFLPFSAGQDFRPETTAVDFRFAFAHTLNSRSSLSYNLGAQLGGGSDELAYIYTLSYGLSLTGKLGAYAEVYGDFPEDSSANHLWDAGLTYLITSNVQLDATLGTSFTEGQDLLLSGGITFRIPK